MCKTVVQRSESLQCVDVKKMSRGGSGEDAATGSYIVLRTDHDAGTRKSRNVQLPLLMRLSSGPARSFKVHLVHFVNAGRASRLAQATTGSLDASDLCRARWNRVRCGGPRIKSQVKSWATGETEKDQKIVSTKIGEL